MPSVVACTINFTKHIVQNQDNKNSNYDVVGAAADCGSDGVGIVAVAVGDSDGVAGLVVDGGGIMA